MNKKYLYATVGISLLFSSANSMAAYVGFGDPLDFSFFPTPTAWGPGANTARFAGAPTAEAGGATWSIMGSGVNPDSTHDNHDGHHTSEISGLIEGYTESQIADIFNSALDTWAAVSGFSNLGQVADGGADFNASEADGGHLGDIRFGAIFIDGGIGSNTLAHAYQPGTAVTGGHTLSGDIHFDDSNTWVDDANAVSQIDLYTVALHEIGHALGLGHSEVSGSVMEAIYAGSRRNLNNDDIDGIRSLYGSTVAAVPVPAPILLFLSGLTALRLYSRKK